ncbi:MAG: VCBS repeat-containing protein [Sandaracinaceae bacterium]|nr:VCBS repeat-containing protein [Sandaracinaceae bacterium]
MTLANFDDDPMAEVVVGAMIFDHDGRLIWDAGTNGSGANFGTNSGYSGGIAVVADLDADGTPELISGRNAYQVAWTPASTGVLASATVTPFWVAAGNDGYPAVADLDGDGTPEVVLVASRQVILLNGQTGDLWCVAAGQCSTPLNIPGGASTNRGGPPTIADFDGDGRAEIGVAGGFSYSVYDVYRPGEDLVYPNGDPAPAPGALYVRWSSTTQDTSSNSTGSSVFDFEGDGAAEVVYADECFLRVYSGTNGVLQLQEPSTSATIHEYPLVVDADGDGNSEILLVANDAGAAGNCGAGVPTRRGLFMYGDTNDAWVPTRRVWTQHAYHVTNASSAGNVPLDELPNWLQPRLNNARQNVQGDGVFNAPDVAVDLSVGLASCPDTHQLRARHQPGRAGRVHGGAGPLRAHHGRHGHALGHGGHHHAALAGPVRGGHVRRARARGRPRLSRHRGLRRRGRRRRRRQRVRREQQRERGLRGALRLLRVTHGAPM